MHRLQRQPGWPACLIVGLITLGLPILKAQATAASAQDEYISACAGCHGKTLAGTLGPPLKGDQFKAKWAEKPSSALSDYIAQAMPPANPGSLSSAVYEQIAEFIRKSNGLNGDGSAGEGGGIASENVNHDLQYRKVVARRDGLLAALPAVTDRLLREPAADDWLSWRRTDDGQGFSPLAQLNRSNASSIGLAWSLTLPAGTNEITPLVFNGVMFLTSHDSVLAIDVDSSDVLWTFTRPTHVRQIGPPITQPRGIAIFNDRLLVPTVDNHILALDVRTGKVIWDHAVSGMSNWMRFTSSPIVVHGKVIEGATGCWSSGQGGRCFIVALDAQSGQELWRFNTIPRSGEPGGDSWNEAPDDQRSGASVWSPGTYNAEDNLVYFGTGQTYHIAPLMMPSSKRSHSNAGLYTDCTLALNPDTGKLVWYFQHMARDVWDLDWAFERTITTLTIDSKPRRVVMTVGKIGVLDVLDAKTGSYLSSHDLGFQNVITAIDPTTGWKEADPTRDPDPKRPTFVCPFAAGVRNWPATSYDASTHLLYLGTTDSCMDLNWNRGEDFDISYNARPRPGGDGDSGGIVALNVSTQKIEWSLKRRAPPASAMLSTGGGLLFEGSRDRYFRALDSMSGEVLWKVRLDNVPSASPITFAAAGVQYVAITTGGGNPNEAIRAFLTPEIEPLPPATTLWVFKLR